MIASIELRRVRHRLRAIVALPHFEAVFMPHMLTSDGRPMIERAQDLLPAPAEQKVVSLLSPR